LGKDNQHTNQMITYYCPHCWTIVDEQMTTCSNCGYELGQFLELLYEDKLLASLKHPVQDIRLMAIKTLGDLGNQRAIPEFEQIIMNKNEDYYILRAVVLALENIPGSQSLTLLERAIEHPSDLVQRLANRIIKRIRNQDGTG